MSGWLPGVGVPHRRRPQQQYKYRQQINALGKSEPSILDMDETALKARLRLQQRLTYLYSYSRSSGQLQDKGNDCKQKARIKNSRSGTKFLGMPWNFQLNKCKSIKTPSVCLEALQDQ